MELSCHENRLNARHQTYLMPNEEMHETPDGDETRDSRLSFNRSHRTDKFLSSI